MTTVARAAVDAHLDEEVTARDHGRAERYVATTKTVTLTDDSDGRRAEEGGVRRTEEGGRATVDLPVVDAAQNESKAHVKETP
ncbi:hypothetical protein PHMEG_00019236 [Phytophthora megakarya]|uniref:Uncharacterized protein n=1 Tax=Phytophthora megakarya TaxID=4795 RepID=A0A225VTB6_9STRA|nr:hypothetical protein PHMEG_00019236 [Phytophthora megakarya]